MGSSKPSGSTTTTQTSEPWAGQKPFLEEQFKAAQGLFQNKTPQYNMDAYNAALGEWETANTGRTPQYDNAGYQSALSAYQSSGKPAVTIKSVDGHKNLIHLSDGSTVSSDDPRWNRDTMGVGSAWGKASAPQGTAPTLEQFLLPGSTVGTKPRMEDYVIPGTEGSSALAPAYYQGQTIADQSAETLAAQDLTTQRALMGSPIMNQAKGYLSDVMGGSYLSPESNPYLAGYLNNALDPVQQRVNSQFAAGGRYGGGANQEVLAREMGKTATNAMMPVYEAERNRMQQGLLFAPQMANQDYFDINQLYNVGANKDARAQDFINEDINKYNYNSNLAGNALRNYIGLTGGNFGSTQTASSPYFQNSGANALGMGLGGLGMLNGIGTLTGAGGLFSGLLGGGSAAGAASSLGGMLAMSDRRAKTDITHIGYAGGFPLYTFRYDKRIDPEQLLRRGVMAQDVVLTRPDAIEWDNGLMKVRYDLIGVEHGVMQ